MLPPPLKATFLNRPAVRIHSVSVPHVYAKIAIVVNPHPGRNTFKDRAVNRENGGLVVNTVLPEFKVRPDLRDIEVLMVNRGPPVQRVNRESKVLQDLMEAKESPELRDPRDLRESKVSKDPRAPRVIKGPPEFKVPPVPVENRDPRVPMDRWAFVEAGVVNARVLCMSTLIMATMRAVCVKRRCPSRV